MVEDKKIQWHPAFYGAMHLELKDNKEELEFTEELILNTLPLRVDMLIIKKKIPCEIQNEIGRIFRKHNLLEYKSPEDKLNYTVFLKGIYYIIKEGSLHIQVVVTKELSRENHIWLNSLSEHQDLVDIAELITTTRSLKHNDEKMYADSLWEVVTRVNMQTMQTVRMDDDMCKALAEIMKPEIDEAFDNGFNNGFNDERLRIIRKKLEKGMNADEIAELLELPVEEVKKLISKSKS